MTLVKRFSLWWNSYELQFVTMEYQSTAFVLPLYCLQPDMYEKKIHYIDSTSVHIIWLNARFYLSNKRSKCFSSHKMYFWWWCTINTLYLCMILNSLSYFQEVLPQLSQECLSNFSSSKSNYSDFLENLSIFSAWCR